MTAGKRKNASREKPRKAYWLGNWEKNMGGLRLAWPSVCLKLGPERKQITMRYNRRANLAKTH